MKNFEIARCFHEIADLLEVKEENIFRIRAYRRAAQNAGVVHTGYPLRSLTRGHVALDLLYRLARGDLRRGLTAPPVEGCRGQQEVR